MFKSLLYSNLRYSFLFLGNIVHHCLEYRAFFLLLFIMELYIVVDLKKNSELRSF